MDYNVAIANDGAVCLGSLLLPTRSQHSKIRVFRVLVTPKVSLAEISSSNSWTHLSSRDTLSATAKQLSQAIVY